MAGVGMPVDGAGPVVPAAVRAVARSETVRLVWENPLGGSTHRLGDGPGQRFVKWLPSGSGLDLSREIDRLRWAVAHVVVPRVLAHGEDDTGSWMVTAALPGTHAASARWRARPGMAVAAIGAGLRALHDVLPVPTCPFSSSVPSRLADVRARAAAGRIDPSRWHPEHRSLSVDEALVRLADAPPVDRVVVCHGDACAPNTLLDDDGRAVGHVDLGELGVADRWSDLAVATWSTAWNFGPGWERPLLDAYGVEPDADRSAFYRLLWDLGP